MKRDIVWICFLAAFLAFVPGTGVFGISLEELAGPEQAKALIGGEKPVVAQFKDPQPQLAPKDSTLQGMVETIRKDLQPGIMVETLHLYKKPINGNPLNAENPVWTPAERASLYNEILALSTLAGLQYFSATRGKMWTFYQTSSVIDGPSTKKPLPDPVYPEPPAQLTLYARQKDGTFGDNLYKYDFYTTANAIMFTQQNLTAMTYGIIPAVSKNNLRSAVAIMDAGDYLLVYIISMAKASSIPGIKDRMGTSFANRSEAIFHWFTDRADTAFGKAYQ